MMHWSFLAVIAGTRLGANPSSLNAAINAC